MAKITNFYKIITPKPAGVQMQDNQHLDGGGLYGNYTWYQRLIQGSATRRHRYEEYDVMDNDVEVARALDTIAEEMTGNNTKTDMPLDLETFIEGRTDVPDSVVMTLNASLRHWSRIHDWENRLFKVARTLAKYGDCFFYRTNESSKWRFIHPKNVIGAIVDERDIQRIIAWQIQTNIQKPKQAAGYRNVGGNEIETEIVPASNVVRFSLTDDMEDTAPFGESVLRSVYRAHKQKELLEDAIIIYRVQRAPERRVFYIDVGKMPPQRVKTYLEQIKNEIKQKKIPSNAGGQSEIESVYNPQSMQEDFFFAQRADGKGSRVETLPGGQGLGELSDLEYFQDKVWRGLRIPVSYMKQGAEGAIFNDGKVGVAYIQEIRFALYIMRLQGHIENVMDIEFKRYIRAAGIFIDESLFRIRLPEPTNFGTLRQQEVDSNLLNTYSSADGIEHLSKRFTMKRYLQLTDDEIIENERLRREELGLPQSTTGKDLNLIYGTGPGDGIGGGMGDDFGGGMVAGGDDFSDAGDTEEPDAGEEPADDEMTAAL